MVVGFYFSQNESFRAHFFALLNEWLILGPKQCRWFSIHITLRFFLFFFFFIFSSTKMFICHHHPTKLRFAATRIQWHKKKISNQFFENEFPLKSVKIKRFNRWYVRFHRFFFLSLSLSLVSHQVQIPRNVSEFRKNERSGRKSRPRTNYSLFGMASPKNFLKSSIFLSLSLWKLAVLLMLENV